jgi:hypothetical protein
LAIRFLLFLFQAGQRSPNWTAPGLGDEL